MTSCNFASLRRSRKGLLHGPSRPFVDKKGVLRGPSWPSVDKKGVLSGPSWPSVDKKGVLSGPSWPFVDKKGVLSGPSWPFVDKKGVLSGPSWPFVDKKGVLRGPSWPFVDQKRCSPRPFADRPNYNLANLSSGKRQRALVQRLPSPPDPCNRSSYARTSTHDFPAPLPSRKSPHNPANPASDNQSNTRHTLVEALVSSRRPSPILKIPKKSCKSCFTQQKLPTLAMPASVV